MLGTGKAAGGGGGKGERRKEQRTELAKWNSLTEVTPRGAVTNALRLHLHNFAYKLSKIKTAMLTLLLVSLLIEVVMMDNEHKLTHTHIAQCILALLL
jgi:hypothetical protein